ncbi:MAG TPA: hypothetical protein VGK89_14450 [Candidatus Eisenbacteria bacterium]
MAVTHDVIVVGSGMSGAHAAQTLVEAGRRVLMLDVGTRETRYAGLVPERDFLAVRESDEDQHRYFLGDDFEGIPWGPAAPSLTPPRRYLTAGTERWCPVRADGFAALESLCYGGLGSGWGAGCAVYPRVELEAMGLVPGAIAEAYRVVAGRIGVVSRRDDATPYCSEGLASPSEPLRMDTSIGLLHAAYKRRRPRLAARGLVMGKDPMAVLTRPLGERGATPYTDMEFWADHEGAVYRPWMTVDALRRSDGFAYEPGWFALSFGESADQVEVRARAVEGGGDRAFSARRLVLACGALGTARIVLRSLPGPGRLPLLTNPYAIAACLHPRMLGRVLERDRTSLGQLEMFHDPRGDRLGARMVSLYTYRSLLLFKLVKEAPLALCDALPLLRALSPALVLATINHPDVPAEGKSCELVPDPDSATGDALRVAWAATPAEERENAASERAILWGLRQLGCVPVKVQHLPPGSAVHYAGTLPFRDDEAPRSLARDGRLAGTRRVHVADGSGFRYLPANGLSFTLMANAHLVARALAAAEP